MKVPNKIRIAGVEYAVKYVDKLTHNYRETYGQIDFNSSEIRINSDPNFSEHTKNITLLHEIIHGIIQNNGIEIEDEEQIIEIISKGMYQVLQDNFDRLFGEEQGK